MIKAQKMTLTLTAPVPEAPAFALSALVVEEGPIVRVNMPSS
jgi:hypothetical protein